MGIEEQTNGFNNEIIKNHVINNKNKPVGELYRDIQILKESFENRFEKIEHQLDTIVPIVQELKEMFPDLKDMKEINDTLKDMKTWSKINKTVVKKITKFIFALSAIIGAIYGIYEGARRLFK